MDINQHKFHHVDKRKLILPFYDRSEFAGLTFEEQSEKIRASWQLFKREGITPTTWVAPAHCFDRITLEAIKSETTIQVISDGIALDQFEYMGFYWIPQQLWSYTDKNDGLWTICLHPNTMSDLEYTGLANLLKDKSTRLKIVGLQDLTLRSRPKGLLDKTYSIWYWQRSRLYHLVSRLRRQPIYESN